MPNMHQYIAHTIQLHKYSSAFISTCRPLNISVGTTFSCCFVWC